MNDDALITVSTQNGEIECKVLNVFESNNEKYEDKKYIALFPLTEQADEILIFGYTELEEDKIDLIEIRDIEEFNAALQQFDGYMKEPGFFVDN